MSLLRHPFGGGHGTPHAASCLRVHPPAGERPASIWSAVRRICSVSNVHLIRNVKSAQSIDYITLAYLSWNRLRGRAQPRQAHDTPRPPLCEHGQRRRGLAHHRNSHEGKQLHGLANTHHADIVAQCCDLQQESLYTAHIIGCNVKWIHASIQRRARFPVSD